MKDRKTKTVKANNTDVKRGRKIHFEIVFEV